MHLPTYADYQRAVQNPKLAFQQDPDLSSCKVDTLLDSPWARTGNFAFTYRLRNGKQWAVRCFSKYDPGQDRYDAISRFVQTHPKPFFVRTEYKKQGILVNGAWYPITKTEWVEGDTLELYIDKNVANQRAMEDLLGRFGSLVMELEKLGIAHGDLQHGNILVRNGALVLIDYDGMYVPELQGYKSNERGHQDYQHPGRTGDEFGPHLDRFSSIVIYLTLKALTLNKELWRRYSAGGDHLILRQADFREPDSSALLAEMEALPGMDSLVQTFRAICKADFAQVPRLADYIAGRVQLVTPAVRAPFKEWTQYPVVWGEDRDRLLQMIGQKVTVVGQISEPAERLTTGGSPYVFMSFGDWRQGNLRLVIWSDTLSLFRAKGIEPLSFDGKWVSVTGLLTEYHAPGYRDRPQIIINAPAEIEVLAGGQEEARRRLPSEYWPRVSPVVEFGSSGGDWSSTQAREHFCHGKEWCERGRLDKAIEEFKAALALSPGWAEARNWLGFAYEQQGRLEGAVKEYTEVLRLEPNNGWTWRQLGRVHIRMGRLDKSLESFQAAIQIDAQDADAHFGLGYVYDRLGCLDRSITEYQTALCLNPKLDMAHNNLGWVYERQGWRDEAMVEYQAAVRINPCNGFAHYNLGRMYREQGKIQEALREFQTAVRLGHEPAKEMLREMGKAQGSWAVDTSGDWNDYDDEVPF